MSTLISSQIIEDVRLVQMVTYSSCALLIWDYLLTLDDEIIYIWGSPSSVVKYLFIGNRYANLLLQLFNICLTAGALPIDSAAACLASSWVIAVFQFWSYSSVHVLVLLRIWILNGRTRKTTIALTLLLFLHLCLCIAMLAYILSAISFNLNTVSAGTCGGRLAPFSWLIWIVECVLEACQFGLMIFTLRQQKSTSEFSRISLLIRGLYRHAVIFLLANSLGDILNTIVWTVFLRTPLSHLPNSLPAAIVNITGQRLAIDLRRLHIQKDVTRSEVSRMVENQLAASDNNPVVP